MHASLTYPPYQRLCATFAEVRFQQSFFSHLDFVSPSLPCFPGWCIFQFLVPVIFILRLAVEKFVVGIILFGGAEKAFVAACLTHYLEVILKTMKNRVMCQFTYPCLRSIHVGNSLMNILVHLCDRRWRLLEPIRDSVKKALMKAIDFKVLTPSLPAWHAKKNHAAPV